MQFALLKKRNANCELNILFDFPLFFLQKALKKNEIWVEGRGEVRKLKKRGGWVSQRLIWDFLIF